MKNKKYHLFEVVGIELEYMLVEQDTLKIAPRVDELFTLKCGSITSDIENGTIAWSNELVAHVIEIKTNGPSSQLKQLADDFHKNIKEINALLHQKKLQLLPTASHPFMNPLKETLLWKHSYSEVYELYNRIFNCKGHGWSNVQSMHINLPFYDMQEFEQLHAAIRVLLPIIPALTASSPILEGKLTGFLDTRLEYYKNNQKKIPVMTGKVIPEQVFSFNEYNQKIFKPIQEAIQPYDTEKVLGHLFLNSRGAIARFDRNAIEIRIIDLQECPKADLAVAELIIACLKFMITELDLNQLKSWHEDELFSIFNQVISEGNQVILSNSFTSLFGMNAERASVKQLWEFLYNKVIYVLSKDAQQTILWILKEGSLSERILKAINDDSSEKRIKEVYHQLGECLASNQLFKP
ncbi:glutamate-cysteine ligase family protein [Mesonia ostreae]|uniref:Glutamate-cysteine ligase family protein n=1 Tax=Mesonia ostreae TaxID=861110 RepID=A0ABU2KJX0_9FLAO|nr:glutamate-cysteine ligase family protein [Mesonia ostreae]MDT0294968.1 glutamate-cysteine ligase family protein [Mesonia ostreae]